MRHAFRLAVAMLLLASSARAQAASSLVRAVDRTRFDTTCAPCQDFYGYVNGAWLDTVTIPASYSRIGVGREVFDRNQVILRAILDSLASDRAAPKGSNAQKLGSFYGSCIDSARAERLGASPLAPELRRIASIDSRAGLAAAVARLHADGADALFSTGAFPDFKDSKTDLAIVFQGGLGMPDRDYYLKTDATSAKLRDEYVRHVARTFRLLGDSPAVADDAAKRVMALETKLAGASMTLVEQRDPAKIYHKMSVDSMQALMPAFDWAAYWRAAGVRRPQFVNVGMPAFLGAANGLLVSVPVGTWRDYLRWRLADMASPTLGSRFVNENFAFASLLSGAKEQLPRWKRCLTATDQSLGEALGEAYVARTFTPEAKARALELVHNLQAALRDRIQGLEWMSDATRKEALAKLDAFRVKIGYPDRWRDYSALTIGGGSYYDDRVAANQFEFRRVMAKADRPTDRGEWGMTPQTVDAYNNSLNNEIVFPAGILQPPLFDASADDAVNYGAIGAVIGHEITHGFDDEGRQFDAEGNLRDWWTPEDAAKYTAQAERIVREYDAFIVADTFHVNGKLTLGENIADLGGLKIAYAALQKALAGKPRRTIDGFTPEQRFFIAYANAWRNKVRPEAATTQSLTDPHSPPRWRVMGVLVNLPEFAQAFGCKAGDAMVRDEAQRAQIW